jgi:V/A-type H+-transporting ATPase subunit F
MASEIAIIGMGTGVLAFKAAGVDAYTATDSGAAREILRKVARDHKVIFLTDTFARDLDDLLKRMLQDPYPVVVPIPGDAGSNGYAVEKMKEQMERALGVDVLFNREDK